MPTFISATTGQSEPEKEGLAREQETDQSATHQATPQEVTEGKEEEKEEKEEEGDGEKGKLTLDILPEEFRNDPALKNFSGKSDKELLVDLAKSYLGAQRLVGKGIRIPGEHSSDEEREEFYAKLQQVDGVVKLPTNEEEKKAFAKKLGVPDKPSEYENFEDIDPDLATFNKEFAHSIGLTNGQYKEMIKLSIENQKDMEKAEQESFEEMKKRRDEILSKEWTDLPERLKGAEIAVKSLAVNYGEEFIKQLEDSGAVNNPIVVAALSQVGEGLKETNSLMDHKVDYGKTRAEIEDEIDQIRKNPSYFIQGEERNKLRNRITRLQKALAS